MKTLLLIYIQNKFYKLPDRGVTTRVITETDLAVLPTRLNISANEATVQEAKLWNSLPLCLSESPTYRQSKLLPNLWFCIAIPLSFRLNRDNIY